MIVEPDDIVWVQDYQLMLLPGLLREHRPALRIGYFHHIPFPSYELFRILPERAEILRGVLGADLVAFHTHDYMRHFVGAAERVLHVEFRLGRDADWAAAAARVDALPMGIDYAALPQGIASNAQVAQPLVAKTPRSSSATRQADPLGRPAGLQQRHPAPPARLRVRFWSAIPNTEAKRLSPW